MRSVLSIFGEFGTIFFNTTLDSIWRRPLLEAVAVRSSVALGERRRDRRSERRYSADTISCH